jgi:hypothetical protein
VKPVKACLAKENLEATSKLHPYILWIGRRYFELLASFCRNHALEDTWLDCPSIDKLSLADL